jgi:hypothetical protein
MQNPKLWKIMGPNQLNYIYIYIFIYLYLYLYLYMRVGIQVLLEIALEAYICHDLVLQDRYVKT